MFKKRILYSDIPRPYDHDAERLVKIVGITLLGCIALAGCLLVITL